jgi:WD40 repeat protein
VVSGTHAFLVGFDAMSLQPRFRHGLRDPQTHRRAAVFDESSATPTVGPDGDVFFGVLGNPLRRHDARGWLLHFDAELRTVETPGSFGWDQTVSVVPSASVPSYQGHSSYLLVSKYNNYLLGPHGDGRMELALLDPHARQRDRFSHVRVLREVRTVLSPHHPPNTPKGTRYEWCVNSVAVDPTTGTAIANNEDGYVYRWDLDTGQLTERLRLNQARGQAYTETVIGPDGTSYAIENGRLYAAGD